MQYSSQAIHPSTMPELLRLRAQVETLAETNRQLLAEVGGSPGVDFIDRCRTVLGVPGSRAKVLSILLEGRVRSKEGILLAYSDPTRDQPSIHMVTTLISYLRKALEPYGIAINTIWGQGFAMSDDDKARVRHLLGLDAAHHG